MKTVKFISGVKIEKIPLERVYNNAQGRPVFNRTIQVRTESVDDGKATYKMSDFKINRHTEVINVFEFFKRYRVLRGFADDPLVNTDPQTGDKYRIDELYIAYDKPFIDLIQFPLDSLSKANLSLEETISGLKKDVKKIEKDLGSKKDELDKIKSLGFIERVKFAFKRHPFTSIN